MEPKIETVCQAKDLRVITVREYLDNATERAREQVLRCCEAKAKAEFLGLLDAPHADLEKILHPGYPF